MGLLKPGLISSHQYAIDHTCEDMIKGYGGQNSQNFKDTLGYYPLWGQPGLCGVLSKCKEKTNFSCISSVQFSSVEHVQGVVSRSPEHSDTLPFTNDPQGCGCRLLISMHKASVPSAALYEPGKCGCIPTIPEHV